MKTCAVIPALNEAATIRQVVESARQHVDRVIVVDDGSEDATAEVIEDLDIELVSRPSPGGKAAALADGFRAAQQHRPGWIITLDGDGQHSPADMPRLLEAARTHPDCLVLGARVRQRHCQPGIRRFANRFADFWISWASAQRVPDSQTGFRVYPCALLERVRPSTRRRHGFVFETALLIDGARAGHPCLAVDVDSVYRDDARPSYFRPGWDVWEIFCFVSRRILFSGFYPQGLWKMLTRPARWHRAGTG